MTWPGCARNGTGVTTRIRFYTAARSIRPETAHELAHLLEQKGESDEAIAVFQDLVRLRPRNGRHLGCLGILLQKLGRSGEAGPFLDAAVAASREAIRLKPDDAWAHNILGIALKAQGKLDEAITEYRAAIRLDPDYALAHNNLGAALRNRGSWRTAWPRSAGLASWQRPARHWPATCQAGSGRPSR